MDSSMMLAALHGDSAVYAHVANADNFDDFDTTTSTTTTTSTITSVPEAILAALTSTTSTTALADSTTTAAPDHDSTISMNNFYPALVQCFGIIICG